MNAELLVKIGDQRFDFRGYRDGDLVCYKPAGSDWSDREHKSFVVLRMDVDEKLLKKLMVDPYTDVEQVLDPAKRYYARAGYIEFDDLKPIFGNTIVTDIRAKDTAVPVLSNIALTDVILKNYIDDPRSPHVFLPGSITSGTYIIDSGGGEDYTTIAGFFADIASLTGNLTGQVQTDTTETGANTIITAMNGNILLLEGKVGNRHSGYPNSGIQQTLNFAGRFIYDGIDTAGRLEARYLDLLPGVTHPSAYFYAQNVTVAHDYYVHHNIMDGDNDTNYGVHNVDPDVTMYVHTNIIWDFSIGLLSQGGNASMVNENNTIWSCSGRGIDWVNAVDAIRNTVSHNAGSASGDFYRDGNVVGDNCASGDGTAGTMGTANNPQTGVVDGNDFESVDDTNAQFLHNKVASTKLTNTGSTGTYSTTDIAGTTRSAPWDIGAHEVPSAAAGIEIFRRRIEGY